MAGKSTWTPAQAYQYWGVKLQHLGVGEWRGACPKCGKIDHFFVGGYNGAFSCKRCGWKGGLHVFLAWVLAQLGKPQEQDWLRLEELRQLPREAFRPYGFRWDSVGKQWVFPVFDLAGRMRDLRRWNEKSAVRGTKGCRSQLWGGHTVKATGRVYVCEGEWDGVALSWLFHRIGNKLDSVVAVPGAHVFKPDWLPVFGGRHVVLCYDADTAGDEAAKKAAEILKGKTASIKYISWPGEVPPGYDLRDAIISKGKRPTLRACQTIWNRLRSLESKRTWLESPPTERRSGSEGTASQNGEYRKDTELGRTPDAVWRWTLGRFKRWLEMTPDLEASLKLSLAVAISGSMEGGPPVWLWLVAAPSAGKTAILMAFRRSERCVFQSSITPQTMISGWKGPVDPSLLPKLFGRCLILKEGTEIFCLQPNVREQLFGMLRGAYDGLADRQFGNGEIRTYEGHFNFLGGITPIIYGRNEADLGERILRFNLNMPSGGTRSRMMDTVLRMEQSSRERDEELCDAVTQFLTLEVPTLKELRGRVTTQQQQRLKALVDIVSMLRAKVPRDERSRNVLYRPTSDVGLKMLGQLYKLGCLLAWIEGEKQLSNQSFHLLQRIALDTAIGFHSEIVFALVANQPDDLRGRMNRGEIARWLGLPQTNVYEALEDLVLKGVLKRHIVGGGESLHRCSFGLSDAIRGMWFTADPGRIDPRETILVKRGRKHRKEWKQ